MPVAIHKVAYILLPSLPFYLSLSLKRTISPTSPNSPAVVHQKDPFPWKLVILKVAFVHPPVKIILASAAFQAVFELTFIEGSVCHFMSTMAIRNIFIPLSLVWRTIRESHFSMRVSFTLQYLPLVRNSIFRLQKNFLVFSQLPQKKCTDKISTILPNNFPPLMRLLLHNTSYIFETLFEKKSLHLVFHWQRVLDINRVADIMFFIMINEAVLFKAGVNVD